MGSHCFQETGVHTHGEAWLPDVQKPCLSFPSCGRERNLGGHRCSAPQWRGRPDGRGLAVGPWRGCGLPQREDTKHRPQREQARGAKCGGDQGQLPESPPRGVTQDGQRDVTTRVRRCPSGTLVRASSAPRGFSWGPVTSAPSAWHVPKFQTPRRKAGVQQKPHCLHQQLRHREPLLAVRECWEPSRNPALQTPGSRGQPWE